MNGLMEHEQTTLREWPEVLADSFQYKRQESVNVTIPRRQSNISEDLEQHVLRLQADNLNLILEIRKKFIFPLGSSVVDFLRNHRSISQILLESEAHLKQYLGSETVLTLKAPIDESGSPTLYAVAIWPGSVKEVVSGLEKFEENWWLANSRLASGNLHFTYELV